MTNKESKMLIYPDKLKDEGCKIEYLENGKIKVSNIQIGLDKTFKNANQFIQWAEQVI